MIRRKRYYLLTLYMAGFFCGILYANFVGVKYITTTGVFHEYFLNQYVQQEVLTERYLMYLIPKRIGPLLFLVFGGMTKMRKLIASLVLLWTGFAGGVLAVASVLRMGITGMLFYLAAGFPHGLFYLFGYMILLFYLMDTADRQWNLWKTSFLILSMTAGILTEVYINPEIVRMIMKFFY